MTYTNDEIKAIAERQLATAEWIDEKQKQDTLMGFRIGFAAAIQMHNLQQAHVSSSATDWNMVYDESDDEEWDADDEEERWAEEEAEYAATCTCGAWVFGKDGKVYHIADCFCGAE